MNNLSDGCKYSPTCDECPLTECKVPQKESTKTTTREDKRAKYSKVIELKSKGVPTREICKTVGYTSTGEVSKILNGKKKIS